MSLTFWTEELILSELQKHIDEHNSLFGLGERKSKLYLAISRRNKPISYYLEKMGYSDSEIHRLRSYVPKDTDWTLDKINIVIKEILDKQSTLSGIAMSHHRLDSAIRKRGGYKVVLGKLGYSDEELQKILPKENKKRKYEDVKNELSTYIEKFGSLKGFRKNNKSLSSYMKKHNLDLVGILDDIYGSESDYHELLYKIPNSYWNEKRILNKLKEYIDTHNDWSNFKIDEKNFYRQVIINSEKLEYYIKKLDCKIDGFTKGKKPRRYWCNYDNFKKEVLLLKDRLGRFPNSNECIMNGINMGHVKSFGGYAKIREELGFVSQQIIYGNDNHACYSHGEVLVDNFLFEKGIPHQKEVRISSEHKYLCDFLLEDNTYVELWGFSNSEYNKNYHITREKKLALYKQMNLKLISINYDDIKKPYNRVIEYLEKIFRPYIQEGALSCNPAHIVPRYEKTLKGIREELQPYIVDNRYFPSEYELSRLKRHDLVWQIKKYGGFEVVAKNLNLLPKRSLSGTCPAGYWTEETIKKELDILYKEFGYIPNYTKIRSHLNKKLAAAIDANGGYKYFMNKFMYKKEKDLQKCLG